MSSVPLPEHNAVHVWCLNTTTAPASLEILSPDEQSRAAQFVFEKDHNQFVSTRTHLRQLLSAYLGIAPETFQFEYGPQGKPILPGLTSDLRFNVSHSHDISLFAFALGHDIGIDVERITDRVDITDLARLCFSPEEQHAFNTTPIQDRPERFFQYWTAKESYIKALGGGLSIPLEDFTISLDPSATVWPIKTTRKDLYTVQPLPVPSGYIGAIATPSLDIRHK